MSDRNWKPKDNGHDALLEVNGRYLVVDDICEDMRISTPAGPVAAIVFRAEDLPLVAAAPKMAELLKRYVDGPKGEFAMDWLDRFENEARALLTRIKGD